MSKFPSITSRSFPFKSRVLFWVFAAARAWANSREPATSPPSPLSTSAMAKYKATVTLSIDRIFHFDPKSDIEWKRFWSANDMTDQHILCPPVWPSRCTSIWRFEMTPCPSPKLSYSKGICLHTRMRIRECKWYDTATYDLHTRILITNYFRNWDYLEDWPSFEPRFRCTKDMTQRHITCTSSISYQDWPSSEPRFRCTKGMT